MHSYTEKRRPRLSLDDLLHVRWLLGGLMAVLSIWTLFYMESQMWPFAMLATVAVLLAVFFPRLPGYVPRKAWHLGVPAIAAVFAFDIYTGEIIPAFVRLTVLLVLYRAVSHRTRREDLQLAVLCLFLVVVTGVLTVSIAFVAQIVAFTAVAMVFLFVVNLIRDAQWDDALPAREWTLLSRKRLLIRLWAVLDMRLAFLGGALLGTVILISTVIFLLIPRIQMDGSLSLFNRGHARSVTGFSENVTLGEVTDIAQDNGIAMRVDVSGEGLRPSVPYWRMVVLDEYGAGAFRLSRAVLARVGARSIHSQSITPDWETVASPGYEESMRQDARYTVYLEGGVSRYLPLPGMFGLVRFTERQDIVPNPVFKVYSTPRQQPGLLSYQIIGADFGGTIPDPDFSRINLRVPATRQLEPARDDDHFHYRNLSYPATTLAVPVTPEERASLRDAVQQITRGEALDARTFADRACDYLSHTHHYSLGVSLPEGKPGDDPVVRWMNAGLSGHCEFFAASFTLLSRTAGYPTRVITGFKGGTWNAYENYYMVRHSDAHAWCEVYDGQGAWFRVDPTPGGGGADGPSLESALAAMVPDKSASAYLDSLRMIWYRRIVSFDKRSQQQVIGSIRETGEKAASELGALARSLKDGFVSWLRSPWTFESRGDLVFMTVVLVFAGFVFKRSGIRVGDLWSWLRHGESDTRRRAGGLLRKLQLRLAEPPGDTRWDVGGARHLETCLIRIRYGRTRDWPEPLPVFRAVRRLL